MPECDLKLERLQLLALKFTKQNLPILESGRHWYAIVQFVT